MEGNCKGLASQTHCSIKELHQIIHQPQYITTPTAASDLQWLMRRPCGLAVPVQPAAWKSPVVRQQFLGMPLLRSCKPIHHQGLCIPMLELHNTRRESLDYSRSLLLAYASAAKPCQRSVLLPANLRAQNHEAKPAAQRFGRAALTERSARDSQAHRRDCVSDFPTCLPELCFSRAQYSGH